MLGTFQIKSSLKREGKEIVINNWNVIMVVACLHLL